jgi:hypothetical protein
MRIAALASIIRLLTIIGNVRSSCVEVCRDYCEAGRVESLVKYYCNTEPEGIYQAGNLSQVSNPERAVRELMVGGIHNIRILTTF